MDHDVGHVWFSVPSLHLILVRQHRQYKVSWFALALSHQKATWFPFLCQKLLCLLAGEVPMVPPKERERREQGQLRNGQSIAFRQELRSLLGVAFMGNPFLGSQSDCSPHWHDTGLSYF